MGGLFSMLWPAAPAPTPAPAEPADPPAPGWEAVEDLLRADVLAPPPAPAPPGPDLIAGYAVVWFDPADPEGTQYRVRPGVVERVRPGAFDASLKAGGVVATVGHRSAALLATQAGGTLRLSVDARGLRFEVAPPPTKWGRRIVGEVKAGGLTGASFVFTPRQVETRFEDGTEVREIVAADLREVGPCLKPCYPAARCWVATAARTGDPAAADLDAINFTLARMGAEDE